MIIVLINWRIKEEDVPIFLSKWKSKFTIGDKPGLVGEFLSRVQGKTWCEKITWEMEASECEDKSIWKFSDFISFVNIGIWDTKEHFMDAVGKYMNDDPEHMEDFEAAPRRRAIVSPEAWRIGEIALYNQSSTGVVD